MSRYKIVSVPSEVARGYYSTVVDKQTSEVLFCSTISGYKEHSKKLIPSEKQAISFINRQEKRDEEAAKTLCRLKRN